MRYVVVGAGAIGGAVAGLLHEAGHPVTVVARGRTHDALTGHGLRLAVGHEERVVGLHVVSSLDRVRWTGDTALLLCVKSQHTRDLLPGLREVPPHVPVLCCQNGVANERVLAEHRELVHGVVVMMPASSLRPGHVVVHSLGRPGLLDLGLAAGGTDGTDGAVADDLRSAGFDSVPRPDVMAWKRRKLLLNLGNAVDAGFLQGDPAEELVALVREEAVRAFEAAGLEVVTQEQDLLRRGELLRPLVRRDEAGSSTWQSLARGARDTEAEHLNGEVVALGSAHGVPTPANRAVLDAVTQLAARGGPPRSLDPAALLRELGRT